MRVALDDTVAVDLLRSREVVLLGVDEEAGVKVLDGHADGEGLADRDSGTIGREFKLAGGHPVTGSNDTHGCWVAGTLDNLSAVGDFLVYGLAEVDEVVRRGQGGDLARGGLSLAVIGKVGSNDSGVEC